MQKAFSDDPRFSGFVLDVETKNIVRIQKKQIEIMKMKSCNNS